MKRLFSENEINTVNSSLPIGSDEAELLKALVKAYGYKAVLKQLTIFAIDDDKKSSRNCYGTNAKALAFVLPSITD